MNGRLLRQAMEVLNTGVQADKYFLAAKIHCHQRSAQRVLGSMWLNRILRICGWHYALNSYHPIPIYILADGKRDVKRPKAQTKAEASRKRRENEEVREREAGMKRIQRATARLALTRWSKSRPGSGLLAALADAALTIPAGYRLVPEEPVKPDDMLTAFWERALQGYKTVLRVIPKC